MTKADIVARSAQQTGVEKAVAMTVVEAFMETVKDSMVAGNEVFLRGFGSYVVYNITAASSSRSGRKRSPGIYRRTRLS